MHGFDFDETYAPVVRFEIVRCFLAIATQYRWSVYQLDIKSAFLNEDLLKEVYVHQPEGFVIQGSEHKVYRLHMSLYGLRQAPRA